MLVCSNLLESDPVADGRKTVQEYLEELKAAFRLLGHKAEKYGVRIGYEPLAWGSVINRWEQVWEVVRDVDMPNVGIIFDSFNSL
jgi:4-hydroxyphenylpyruvate dioxygenase